MSATQNTENGAANMNLEAIWLKNDNTAVDVETGLDIMLSAGEPVLYAGIDNGREFFYVEDSQGWGLCFSATATFTRRNPNR